MALTFNDLYNCMIDIKNKIDLLLDSEKLPYDAKSKNLNHELLDKKITDLSERLSRLEDDYFATGNYNAT